MLSLIAPSFLVIGIPFMSVLLVIPATTMLSDSSNKITAGLVLISKVSVNCNLARTTSQGLSTLPCLVFFIIP